MKEGAEATLHPSIKFCVKVVNRPHPLPTSLSLWEIAASSTLVTDCPSLTSVVVWSRDWNTPALPSMAR